MDRQQLETIFTSSAFLFTNGLLFVNLFILANALGNDGRGAVAAAYGNTVVIGWAFQIGVPNAAAYFAKDIDNRRVMMSSWMMMLTAAVVLVPLHPMGRVAIRSQPPRGGAPPWRSQRD